jgi:hypothetical protein
MTVKDLKARLDEFSDDYEVNVEDEYVNNDFHHAVFSISLGNSKTWLDGELIDDFEVSA